MARKDAFLLLLALDGLGRYGTYTHEDAECQQVALRNLANDLSSKLSTLGRRVAAAPEP